MKRDNKRPIPLKVYSGEKPKLSNDEINHRMEHAEKMTIGGKVFIPSPEVLENEAALKKWNELIKKYKGFEFITDVDNGILQHYCLLEGELVDIIAIKREIENDESLDLTTKLMHLDKLKVNSHYLKILDTMLKYEDRLYLNPAARLKSIPAKKEEKKESRLESLGFGNL